MPASHSLLFPRIINKAKSLIVVALLLIISSKMSFVSYAFQRGALTPSWGGRGTSRLVSNRYINNRLINSNTNSDRLEISSVGASSRRSRSISDTNDLCQIIEISSLANEKVKLFQSLKMKKVRDKTQLVLVEGGKVCVDALKSGLVPMHLLMTSAFAGKETGREILQLLTTASSKVAGAGAGAGADYAYSYITEHVLSTLSDTVQSQGVLAAFHRPAQVSMESFVAAIPSASTATSTSSASSALATSISSPSPSSNSNSSSSRLAGFTTVAVLDGVSDPGNLGTLIRSAYGLGIDSVVCINNCCDIWSPKVLRSSCGLQLGKLPVVAMENHQFVDFITFFLQHFRSDRTIKSGSRDNSSSCSSSRDSVKRSSMEDCNCYVDSNAPQILITGVGHAEGDATNSSSSSKTHDEINFVHRPTVVVFGSEAHGVSPETRNMIQSAIISSRGNINGAAIDSGANDTDKKRRGGGRRSQSADAITNSKISGSRGSRSSRSSSNSDDYSCFDIHIPMERSVESFNVGVAGSIIFSEAQRQRRQWLLTQHHHHQQQQQQQQEQ